MLENGGIPQTWKDKEITRYLRKLSPRRPIEPAPPWEALELRAFCLHTPMGQSAPLDDWRAWQAIGKGPLDAPGPCDHLLPERSHEKP